MKGIALLGVLSKTIELIWPIYISSLALWNNSLSFNDEIDDVGDESLNITFNVYVSMLESPKNEVYSDTDSKFLNLASVIVVTGKVDDIVWSLSKSLL